MPDLWTTLTLPLLLCAAAGVGHFVRARLPERHRSRESIELAQVSITLLTTFAAIVLGLLTTSVKQGFDDAYRNRGIYAGELAQMDQCLRDYGPETAPMRNQLKAYVAAVIASTWPNEPHPTGVNYPDTSHMPLTGESPMLGGIINQIGQEVRLLEPTTQAQRDVQAACSQQYANLVKSRWTVIEEARGSISEPFYWVLVIWLVILFACLGLSAPSDAMTAIVIFLAAVSISIAVFAILDLDLPYGGVFGIPSTSMRNALADMMR